jgi:hypothetical protein
MPTRIYKITPPTAEAGAVAPRLVRATTSAQALRFVASEFLVDVASQDDLEQLLTSGVKVEKAAGDAGDDGKGDAS